MPGTPALTVDPTEQLKAALLGLRRLKARVAELEAERSAPIAVVGMACRFPGADDPDALWRLVAEGRDAVGDVPADRFDVERYFGPADRPGTVVTRRGGFLDDVTGFDAEHFHLAPREARAMDPQQRLLLEVAWLALEDAGRLRGIEGSSTGVYLGFALTDWAQRTLRHPDPAALDVYAATGMFGSVAAGRLSYTLGLRGPSLALDTACSSSLVAVHLACQALRAGECDLALAGGVNLILSPDASIVFSRMGALAPDGVCKAFDAAADGYVRSEGVGLVVLKRLDAAQRDGDRVLAVIRGSAVDHDGRSNGLTAPSGPAQQAVIEAALRQAGLAPGDVGYVQAHGTGTPLGDPIEVEALLAAYGAGAAPLRVGSVKANLGHAETAAGVASLIQTVQALRHRQIPGNPHLRTLNPRLRVAGTRLRFPTTTEPWTEALAAGVSAFGMGGTNAHVVLTAAPDVPSPPSPAAWVLPLSARDDVRLEELRADTVAALAAGKPGDVARALGGRATEVARVAVVAADADEARAALAVAPVVRARSVRLAVVLGDGAPGSAWSEAPAFRAAVAEAGREVADVVGGTDVASRVVVAWAVGRTLQAWGVPVARFVGRGAGAAAAAVLSGELGLDAALGGASAPGHDVASPPSPLAGLAPGDTLDTDTVPDVRALLTALARLWERGLDVDWRALQPGPPGDAPRTRFHHVPYDLPDPHEAARAAARVDPRVWRIVVRPFEGAPVRGGPWQVEHAALAVALRDAPADPALRPRVVRVVTEADADPEAWLAAVAPAPGPLHLVVVGDGVAARAVAALAAVRAVEDPDAWGGLLRVDRLEPARVAAALTRADGRDLALAGDALTSPVLEHGEARSSRPPVCGTWWITGGTGAVGLAVADELAARGVRRLLLTARRPPAAEAEAAIEALRARGVDVRFARADVGDRGALDRLVTELDDLRGVVHAAGVVDDRPLADVTPDDLRAALAPKLDGARNLLAATEGLDLDAFAVVGSASVALGVRGQAAYAAANAAASAVVAAARAAGRPATCLAFGPWDVGMADASVRRRLAALGVLPLAAAEAVGLLGERLGGADDDLLIRLDPDRLVRASGSPRLAALLGRPVAPARAAPPSDLRGAVLEVVAAVLGTSGPEAVRTDVGLFDLGLDSMTAVALARELEARLGRPVPTTVAFDHGTVDALVAWLGGVEAAPTPEAVAVDGPVAIVGAACRFPGGVVDPDGLWRLLVGGVDAVGPVPASRWDADALGTAREGGFLEGVEDFDPAFFGISPREARALDPQHRLLLECGVEALERAAIPLDSLRGTPVGVFVGIGASDYARRFDPRAADADPYAGTGNQPSFAAGRLAYALGVQGPAVGLDTACSSSLVATHLGCSALRDGDCDVALVGGVNLLLSPETTLQLGQLQALSPTGRCRTFDADADGYVRAEGAGLLVLKRLADAERDGDPILAVIRGSGVNHDGPSAGLTVPSGDAQRKLLATTLRRAGVAPADVGFLEAHGTGTRLGDPVELGAVREVYGRRPAERPLVVSSVKTHLGHAELAAGVAGLLSAVLTLRHRTFAPHLHLRHPNPALPLDFPVHVPARAEPWTGDGPRLAAVSSFGLSGTNAHVVLEAAAEATAAPTARAAHPIVLSATSEEALRGLAGRLADAVAAGVELPDAALTLATGRTPRTLRLGLAARDADEAVARLRAAAAGDVAAPIRRATSAPTVLLFTGQGAQLPRMARALHRREPVFRDVIDRCDAVVREVRGASLWEAAATDAVHDTAWTQPALFAVELGLAALWRQVAPEPAAVAGHSIGELAAATVAGLWSLEDAVAIVEARARLMAGLPRTGGMAQVGLDEDAVRARLAAFPSLSVAAVNAPRQTVVSGDLDALDAFLAAVERDGVAGRRLTVSHAFHSAAMDPILDAFEAVVAARPARTPRLPVLSNLTGRAETEALTAPSYWRRHLREAVRFADGLRAAPAGAVFVELGPRATLSAFGRRVRPSDVFVGTLDPDGDDVERLAGAVAGAWAAGADVDVGRWWAGEGRRRVELPTTPWVRTRCWVERAPDADARAVPGADVLLVPRWAPHTPSARPGGPVVVVGEGADALVAALVARGVDARAGDDVVAGATVVDLRHARATDDVAPLRDALATAQATVREGARLTLVVGDGPTGDALVGLLRGLAEEHPARVGQAVRWDGVDVDALARALGDDAPELRVTAAAIARPVLERTAGRPLGAVAGTWWIPGGTGAVGRAIAGLLIDLGAGRIVLSGRRGATADLDVALAPLRARATVDVVAVDVADAGAVRRLVDGLADLGGVVHAAGALADRPFAALTPDDLDVVLRGKVIGARAVVDALGDRDVPLVLVSSAAGALGWTGQAAYGAANAWLDGLARARRARGLPTTSVAFGPWEGAGMAADGARAAMAAAGMRPLAVATALGALRRALGADEAELLAVDLDAVAFARTRPRSRGRLAELLPTEAPPSRPGGHDRAVREVVALVLGHADPAALDATRGLFDLGLDSLTAVQLARELAARVGVEVPDTVAFDHPSVDALVTWLDRVRGDVAVAPDGPRRVDDDPVALVGLAVRFPGGADDLDAFWRLLLDGRDAVRPVPLDRWDAEAFYDPTPGTPGRSYVRRGAFLDDVAGFEPAVFGISPREAARIDPQQRLLLELGWLALEQAGIAPDALHDTRCGVFVGIGGHDYERVIERAGPPGPDDAYTGTGNDPAFAAGRLAYVLGTHGPALSLDTACSSSLVALHLGVEALRSGDADLALCGGVRLMLSPEETLRLSALQALSASGRCATFDADADGYVRGEGAGIVVLERLSDARRRGHPVLAVVAGSAVNHDGASGGLTVPSGTAQEALLRRALAVAGLRADEVDVLEAHGTGTPLGDPIELGAVAAVHAGRERPLLVGSVKTNLGHLELAAGVAGIAKAVLALRHDTWPAHLHLRTPNPRLPATEALAIPTSARPWPHDHRRVVGVSAFGLSGTNAHVLLADPTDAPPSTEPSRFERHLLPVSAVTADGLDAAARALADRLVRDDVDLADVAWTLATGRARLPHRRVVVAADAAEAVAGLRDRAADGLVRKGAARPPVAFLLTGQGSQHAGMGRRLHELVPAAREVLDRCDAVMRDLRGEGLLPVLFGEGTLLGSTAWTQPALYALEVAVAAAWARVGLHPDLLLGHSVGELAAAHLAGVWSLEDGLRVAEARGRLMAALPRDGAMVAVAASEQAVRARLVDDVDVAAVNAPDETVISGGRAAVLAVAGSLERDGVRCRELDVSHPFHSARMAPMLAAFADVVASVPRRVPGIPVVSNLTGRPEREALVEVDYWVRHVRAPVRFADAVRATVEAGARTLIEVGPHPVLAALGARCVADADVRWIPSLRRGVDDEAAFLGAVARVHAEVVDLDLAALHEGRRRRSLPLPGTVFQRRRCWVDAAPPRPSVAPAPRLERTWTPLPSASTPPRRVALVGDPDVVPGLTAALAAAGHRIVARDAHPDVVAWLGPLAVGDGVDDASEALRTVTEAWLGLLREGEAPIAVLTRDAAVRPSQAALAALVRVGALEQGRLVGPLVDLGGDVDPAAVVAALLDPREDEQRVTAEGRSGLRLRAVPPGSPRRWTVGPVLVTGGTGAVGLAVAAHLVDDGVRALALVARRAPGPDAEAALAGLRARGARVEVIAADVAAPGEAARALDEGARRLGAAPRAIVHAAGVLDDVALGGLTWDRARAVLAPKVDGALALWRAAGTLDALVLVSSATSWLGATGQGSYALANGWLDGFAGWLRARGAPATSVAFGPWAGAGMAAAHGDAMRARGVIPLAAAAATAALDVAVGEGVAAVAVADADWATWRAVAEAGRRRASLDALAPSSSPGPVVASVPSAAPVRGPVREAVRGAVAAVLGLTVAELDPAAGFFDLGLDSLGAVALAERLTRALGRPVASTDVFDHPTVDRLARHLDGAATPTVATTSARPADEPIAIVGLACRFPGAPDADAFWRLLVEGRSAVGEVPTDRWPGFDALYDPRQGTPGRAYTRAGAFLDDIAGFDPRAFGVSPREAEAMDPQQRLVLEVAYEALQDAAIARASLAGTETGVWIGMGASEYDARFQRHLGTRSDAYAGTGNDTSFAAGRIAWLLGLQGPALTVNTACSAALVAVHLAARALRDGECGLALAGAVNLMVAPESHVRLSAIGALSPTGACRAFDAAADGYVRGEGAGVLVLERLSDAHANGHRVLAIVRGSAVNHAGPSSGLTAPSGPAQTRLLRTAWARAGVTPDDLGYVEAHGTGTRLGDPIEARALAAALGDRRRPLRVGSAKTNVGHLELAAGAVGLVKTVLALRHGVVPAHLHLRRRNPEIPDDLPLDFPTVATPWEGPRVAGVSSFGLSGTNAHVVLEAAPEPPPSAPAVAAVVVPLAAPSEGARDALAAAVAARVTEEGLVDLALTAALGRTDGRHRVAVVGRDVVELAAALRGEARGGRFVGEAPLEPPKVAFVFSGQGGTPGASELLAASPVFRAALEEIDRIVAPLWGASVVEAAAGREELGGPALFAFQVALARLWADLGVRPDAVLGHGVGEVAAACVAGVWSVEDAARFVVGRTRALLATPPGSMAMVRADEARVAAAIAGRTDVAIASVNAADEVVVSGADEGVAAVVAALPGVTAIRLAGRVGWHSPRVDGALDAVRLAAAATTFHAPAIPIVSARTGALDDPELLTAAGQAARARSTVRFGDGVRTLVDLGASVLVEVGPHPLLLGAARRAVDPRGRAFLASHRVDRGWETFLESAAAAWVRGVPAELGRVAVAAGGRRVGLPTVPYERVRCWVDDDAPVAPVAPLPSTPPAAPPPDVAALIASAVAELLGIPPRDLDRRRPLAWQGFDSIMATELVRRLSDALGVDVPAAEVVAGPSVDELVAVVTALPRR